MIGVLAIATVTFALVISERVDRTIAAALGAAAVILLGYIPYEEALQRIDLDVVFLLVGMMMVVNTIAETGFFEWVAIVIAQKARGYALRILIGLVLATAVLSAFLDNVTTVVLVAPITILITQILGIPTAPFLILEAVFSNIGGTATLIGDPPNLLIGSAAGLTFNDFIIHITPTIIVVTLAAVAYVYLFYRKGMETSPAARERIERAQPHRAIIDPPGLRKSLIVFAGILVGFALSHRIGIGPGFAALAGSLVMLFVCRTEVSAVIAKVEWQVIFFLSGLFIIVGALDHQGVFARVSSALVGLLGQHPLGILLAVLWLSAGLAALLGNLPVVIAMIPLTEGIIRDLAAHAAALGPDATFHIPAADEFFWALALGTCLGGNGTLLGAAANIIISQIGHRNGCPITFAGFLRMGLPLTLISLGISTAYMCLRFWLS